ncbi:hypothetical protein B0T14DRAFT_499921 [Immersiella caudata]|uniref:histidine kinase n=1 Tax=Immersiella caudata TaxID=314043 RepID=A0AA39WG03_9PEZI|nr:hypothetical protein B0T14DRAFT_499921 [Immersiella caudata]
MFVDAEPCRPGEDPTRREEAAAAAEACAIEKVEEFERARQREIAAYLLAASFPMDLEAGPRDKPFINPDPTLNALCQLGALRLRCDRSFISLIDRQYQWVVAETTRSHSIREMKWEGDNDRIAFGVTKLEYCYGVCPTTMQAFLDETGAWQRREPNVIADNTRYIVNDFRTDAAYAERPYVVGFPYFVSYLEVPLVSPLGYLLGSYCVVHSDLKDYDNEETVGTMNDIAASIMVYLDGVRLKQSLHRSEDLIAGLTNFVASDPSATVMLQEFPVPSTPTPTPTPSRPPAPEKPLSPDPSKRNASSSITGKTRPALSNLVSGSSIESSISTPSLPGLGEALTPLTSLGDDGSQGLAEQLSAGRQTSAQGVDGHAPGTPVSSNTVISEHHSNGFISSANIKSAFFRAAKTIQQGMGLDGIVFLDAAPTAYFDLLDQEPISHGDESAGPFCAAIVQSSADREGGSSSSLPHHRLPEAVLQRLIRRFPGPSGHIFSADELGPIDESYAPGKPYPGMKASRSDGPLRGDVAALFRVIPEAKYIIFLPLWHFQRECWYAATLGWVTDLTRAILPTDTGLLAAFGNSLMADVSRMEAIAASRAKSSFVSSISHELRSPLHGILASSELLRSSISDPSLLSTLDMLDSCGRTLLHTFNSLLDHAITIKDGLEISRSSAVPATKLEVLDLAELLQDVVDVVHFSHLSERAYQSSLTGARNTAYSSAVRSEGKIDGLDHPLLIMLDIEKRDWKMPVDAGVWKRLIINLQSNALKYTESGSIEIRLQMVQKTDSTGSQRNFVCLKVEDTGKGMSSDYIKYRLFTPFSQEDSYAPGIGLGLSIVQQLAKSQGGSIDVKSSVGIGTVVEVCLPAPVNESSCGVTATDLAVSPGAFDQSLRGRTLCLITPEVYHCLVDSTPKRLVDKSKRSAIVERAIQINSCGMELTVASGVPLPKADIYLLDTECFRNLHQDKTDNILLPSALPLLLLCSGAEKLCHDHDTIKNHAMHLHHPINSKKIFSAVTAALATPQLKSPGGVTHNGLPAAPSLTLLSANPQASPVIDKSDPGGNDTTPESSAGLPPPTTFALHLLLVDDNPINIRVLENCARKLKHTYATAFDGLEAVQLYKKALDEQRPFDMVWMDLQMPNMDGFEAIRQIRRLEVKTGITGCMMVALTGLSSEDSKKGAMASGASTFLTKPVRLTVIKQVLDDQLQKKQAGTGA